METLKRQSWYLYSISIWKSSISEYVIVPESHSLEWENYVDFRNSFSLCGVPVDPQLLFQGKYSEVMSIKRLLGLQYFARGPVPAGVRYYQAS